jgi:hypothetical protein
MALFAIELNDAAITVAGPEGVVAGVPGYAAVVDSRTVFGLEAWQQSRLHPRSVANRFWREFSDESLPRPLGPFQTSADLAHAQLETLLAALPVRPAEVLFAVPPCWQTAQLGLLLGLAEELALPVRGLVDIAVAATRCEYPDHRLLHLDASLHDVTATRLSQDAWVSFGDRQVIDSFGVIELERVCVAFIASGFLQTTRFDPLHNAHSEQYLYDNLYVWLAQLQRQSEIGLTIPYGGNEFRAVIRRDELAARVAGAFEPIVRQLRGSVGASERVAVQVTARLARFPGVVESLAALPQAAVFELEPGAAATGALQRAEQFAPGAAGVGLTSELSWDRPAAELSGSAQTAADSRGGLEPTHLLHDGLVYRLGTHVFHIGAELATGEAGLSLGAALGGVSRRHCSIRRGPNGVELVDHSRFGTRLNGHAIENSVILQSDDVIGIGSPPVQLRLVREVDVGSGADGT